MPDASINHVKYYAELPRCIFIVTREPKNLFKAVSDVSKEDQTSAWIANFIEFDAISPESRPETALDLEGDRFRALVVAVCHLERYIYTLDRYPQISRGINQRILV